MNEEQTWHIVKRPAGNCEIILSNQLAEDNDANIVEKWGPIASQSEAIGRRVGLIRAGKCQPI